MEGLKKRIDVEHDRFKVFLSLSALVIGGVVGLLFREMDLFTISLVVVGSIIGLIYFLLALRSFAKTNKLLKMLEEVEKHV